MTILENTKNDKLVAIYDLLEKQEATFENFVRSNGGNEKNARKSLVKQIKSGLKESNYDGPLDQIEPMLWFANRLSKAPCVQNITPKQHYNRVDDFAYEKIKKILNEKTRRLAKDDSESKRKMMNKKYTYKQFYSSYNEKVQDKLVKDIVDTVKKTPSDWYIDFDLLNNYGRKQLYGGR